MKLKKNHICVDAKNCSAACCCEKHLRSRSVVYCCSKVKMWKQPQKAINDALITVDDCRCDLERRAFGNEKVEEMNLDSSDHIYQDWTCDSEPAVLQYFDLSKSSKNFLESLGPPPTVEYPVLPKYQRKGVNL